MTDSNGIALVTYKAPNDISNLESAEVNITTLNNQSTTLEINFNFVDNSTSKIILVPSKLTNVTSNFSTTIDIYTLNNQNRPISDTVYISIPIEGEKSYGTFSSYRVQTDENGHAQVTYTAPNEVINGKEYNVTFTSSNEVSAILPIDFVSNEVVRAYSLNVQISSSLPVNSSASITISVKDSDGNDVEDFQKLTLTSENGLIYFSNNSNQLTKNNLSSPYIENIKTSTHSGIDVLKVEVSVDNEHNLTEEIPVTVISGPVSTVSINALGTPRFNSDSGLIEQDYILHAVDKYGNPANPGTRLYVGLVVGVKVEGNESGRLIRGNPAEFNDSNNVDYVQHNVQLNDTLIVFPNANKFNPSYLGGWVVNSIESNTTLGLDREYNTTEENLSYVVGNERRFVGNGIYTADVDKTDKVYEITSDGNTKVTVKYDPYLGGHTFFLYSNFVQNDIRIGNAIKDLLKPLRLEAMSNSGGSGYYDFSNNTYYPWTTYYEGAGTAREDIILTEIINGNIIPAVDLIIKDSDFVIVQHSEGCSYSLSQHKTDEEGKFQLSVTLTDTDNNVSTIPTCTIKYIPKLHYEY